MKDSNRLQSANRRNYRICVFLILVVFAGLFYQVLRAFDVQAAVATNQQSVSSASRTDAPSSKSSESASVSAVPSSANTLVASKPDNWSDGEIVSALSSFYQTIIAYMAALLTVVGFLAVVTLRFLSKAEAEAIAHESVKTEMQHYFNSQKFIEDLGMVSEDVAVTKRFRKDLERLEREISIVKNLLTKQAVDQDKDETDDGTVSNARNGGG